MKFFLFTIISFLYSLFLFNPRSNKINSLVPIDSTKTVTLCFVGDLMCHSPQTEYAKIANDSFDFKPAFREIKKYLSSADLTFGNLETTISGKEKKYSGYPLFNSPDEYLEAVKDAGFDILFTSNNHSLDRSKNGIIRTISKIHELGMIPIGTYQSQQEKDSVFIIERNGIQISVLSYTYGLNGNYLPESEKYLVNVIDTNLVKADIEKAKNRNTDFIIIYFHFGNEYQRKPGNYQKEIVQSAIRNGADIIIGSHPHVIQPVELLNSTANKAGKVLVAYSLGNFISNQRWRYSDAGVILNLTLVKNFMNSHIGIQDVNFIPTWVFKGKVETKNEFVVLTADTNSISNFTKYLSKKDKSAIFQANDDTRRMMQSILENYPRN